MYLSLENLQVLLLKQLMFDTCGFALSCIRKLSDSSEKRFIFVLNNILLLSILQSRKYNNRWQIGHCSIFAGKLRAYKVYLLLRRVMHILRIKGLSDFHGCSCWPSYRWLFWKEKIVHIFSVLKVTLFGKNTGIREDTLSFRLLSAFEK